LVVIGVSLRITWASAEADARSSPMMRRRAATVLAKTGISRPRMRSIQPARSGEFGL
jgi:hypothetical protein